MTVPKISIIVPVYNVYEYIDDFFACLRAQTFVDYEAIVWDDGSSDGSAELCDIAAIQDTRIRVFHSENQGVALARRSAVAKSKGKYIAFADPDDVLAPGYLKEMFDLAEEENLDLVASQCFEEANPRVDVSSDGGQAKSVLLISGAECAAKILDRDFDSSGCPIRAELWGKLYRRSLFEGVAFPVQRTCSDVMLLAGVICRVKQAAVMTNKLYHYRISRKDSLQTKVALGKLTDIWNSHEYMTRKFRQSFIIKQYYYIIDEYCTLFHIFTNIMQWSNLSDSNELREAFFKYQKRLKSLPYSKQFPMSIRMKRLIYFSGYAVSKSVFHMYLRTRKGN